MKKLLALAVVSTVAYGGWRWQHHSSTTTDKPGLALDRVWLDHIPRGERDQFNVFLASSEQSMGIFQRTTIWKGEYESFRFEASGGEIRIVYPSNGDRESVRVKARECDEGGFDYCLELDGASRGVKRYYSREGWEIGNLDQSKIEDIVQHAAE
jgi:hypothetical protein